MLARFDESLVTGYGMIDEQHMELINRINELIRSCEEGSGRVKAIKMLDYLADYTDFHFAEEEKLQEEIQYPGIEEHKMRHEEFRVAVKELREMTNEELNAKLKALKQEMFNLRFSNATGQLSNPMQLVACKKDIARIKTLLTERELNKKAKA